MEINDKKYGKKPYIVNIEEATVQNEMYRTTMWTGEKLQVTVMSIQPNDDIGLEVHHGIDQFIRIEEGNGLCKMGPTEDNLNFEQKVKDDDAVFVPADMWHNILNTGDKPLILSNVQPGCGCTASEYTKEPILLGKKGEIKVHYNTATVAPFKKTIDVFSNDPANGRIVLYIQGTVVAQ